MNTIDDPLVDPTTNSALAPRAFHVYLLKGKARGANPQNVSGNSNTPETLLVMSRNIKEYENLIGLLLGPVRERPAMYLGEARLTKMPNFITGYEMGYQMTKTANSSTEHYFDAPGFLNWYFEKNNIGPTSTWMNPFWDEAKGDDFAALNVFFQRLEEYSNFLNHK